MKGEGGVESGAHLVESRRLDGRVRARDRPPALSPRPGRRSERLGWGLGVVGRSGGSREAVGRQSGGSRRKSGGNREAIGRQSAGSRQTVAGSREAIGRLSGGNRAHIERCPPGGGSADGGGPTTERPEKLVPRAVRTSRPSGPRHAVAAPRAIGGSVVCSTRQLTYGGFVTVHSGRICSYLACMRAQHDASLSGTSEGHRMASRGQARSSGQARPEAIGDGGASGRRSPAWPHTNVGASLGGGERVRRRVDVPKAYGAVVCGGDEESGIR